MADLFISYTWIDQPFVKRLEEALKDAGMDVWVDYEDIPQGENIKEEFIKGVIEADVFLPILSPDYLVRPNCQAELDQALKNGKRVVPVVRRQIEFSQFNEHIGGMILAIFCRETDDFHLALTSIIEAIRRDNEYVREHTRLLGRSLQWKSKEYNASFLLRGADLREAEAWQATSTVKDPKPTELQTEYIFTSRKAERARQRTTMVGISIALVVAIGLSILSFLLFQTAEARRVLADSNAATALYNEGVSRSIALAAQGQLELENGIEERAVLLGLEALENYPYSWQAERLLGTAIHTSKVRHVLSGHTDAVNFARWSPEGNRIVTASDDGTARIWEAATGTELQVLVGHSHKVLEANWSPDGKRVLTVSADGTAKMWDSTSGTELRTFVIEQPTDQVNEPDFFDPRSRYRAGWSPNGERIVVIGGNNAMVWSATSGEKIRSVSGGFSTNGTYIFALENSTAQIWDVNTETPVLTLSGFSVNTEGGILWSPDNRRFMTVSWIGQSLMGDIQTGQVLGAFSDEHSSWYILDADWSPDGSKIIFVGMYGLIQAWDTNLATNIFDLSIGGTGELVDTEWSPDNSRFLTVYDDSGGIYGPQIRNTLIETQIWDATNGGLLYNLRGHSATVNSASWSPDGKFVVTASEDHTARIWNAEDGEEVLNFINDYYAQDTMDLSPSDTQVIESSLATNETYVWNVTTGKQMFSVPGQGSALSKNGRYIFTLSSIDAMARVWDASTGSKVFEFVTNYNPEEFFVGHRRFRSDWSPDNRYIATVDQLDTATEVKVWDAFTGNEVHKFNGHRLTVTDVAWSPNGNWIASSSQDGTVRIWNFISGEQSLSLEASNQAVNAIAWSPDSTRIAMARQDGVIQISDANTGAVILNLRGHASSVSGVVWSPDGTRIISTSAQDFFGVIPIMKKGCV